MDSLTQAIEQIIVEKTFTADALAGIQKLKEKAISLESDLATANQKNERYKEQINQLSINERTLVDQVESYNAELDRLQKRVAELEPSGYEAEKQKAVAEAYRWTMETVFRPASVRRSIQGNVAVRQGVQQPNGNFGGGDNLIPNQTIETEVEE